MNKWPMPNNVSYYQYKGAKLNLEDDMHESIAWMEGKLSEPLSFDFFVGLCLDGVGPKVESGQKEGPTIAT